MQVGSTGGPSKCDIFFAAFGAQTLHKTASTYDAETRFVRMGTESWARTVGALGAAWRHHVPDTPLVWMTMSSVRYARHEENFPDGLYCPADVARLNSLSEKALAGSGVPSLDVFPMTDKLDVPDFHRDGVHVLKRGNLMKAQLLLNFLAAT
mmetsp:Transcript_65754/g.143543  ORF Transcript_65754/g.143543 Transcript_65754/m.143543 type:complete len:152 (+) Transcript_65754:301-756(+)